MYVLIRNIPTVKANDHQVQTHNVSKCLRRDLLSEEQFSFTMYTILLEYYKVIVKGLSSEGL